MPYLEDFWEILRNSVWRKIAKFNDFGIRDLTWLSEVLCQTHVAGMGWVRVANSHLVPAPAVTCSANPHRFVNPWHSLSMANVLGWVQQQSKAVLYLSTNKIDIWPWARNYCLTAPHCHYTPQWQWQCGNATSQVLNTHCFGRHMVKMTWHVL